MNGAYLAGPQLSGRVGPLLFTDNARYGDICHNPMHQLDLITAVPPS